MDNYIPGELRENLWLRAWFQANAAEFARRTPWGLREVLTRQVPDLPYQALYERFLESLAEIDESYWASVELKCLVACASKSIALVQPFAADRMIANRRDINLSFAVSTCYEACNPGRLLVEKYRYRTLLIGGGTDMNGLVDFLTSVDR